MNGVFVVAGKASWAWPKALREQWPVAPRGSGQIEQLEKLLEQSEALVHCCSVLGGPDKSVQFVGWGICLADRLETTKQCGI
jgi:hypothetical protein